MIQQTTKVGRMVCVGIIFISMSMASAFAGSFTLSRSGETYTLVADQAALSDILADIDRQEPAALRFYGGDDRAVSATYRNVSLDNLLDRLGVSYVLTYEAGPDGAYRLSDAMTLDSDGMGVDPATANVMRKHIRDLRNDDTLHNAHHAYYALMDMECDAIPFLEQALHEDDFQCRQAAAQLLRMNRFCPDWKVSDRLLDVTFEALDQEHDTSDLAEFIWLGGGYEMLLDSGVYARVRSRILNNLSGTNGRVRLYSSLLAARHGESASIPQLVRIMAPHLADNDLPGDAAAAASALHQLGPAALPYLQPYRTSTDIQQAELAELIGRALETGAAPSFNPVMYYGYTKNPVTDDPWPSVNAWSNDRFPDANGQYPNLVQPRMSAADIYGTEVVSTYDEQGSYYESEELTYGDSPDLEPPFPYTIKPGETLDSIALKFSADKEEIYRVNSFLPRDAELTPGMRMNIPWN